DEADFTDSDIEVLPTKKPKSTSTKDLSLITPAMGRRSRIVNTSKPEDAALIQQSTKAGPEYYDSDAEDLPGPVKGVSKPELYRNVQWGSAATCDQGYEDSVPHSQLVPGRWERQPDGTLLDQKFKLLVKFVDTDGHKKVYTNPPPKDWNDQAAISALNKRIAQQWRRGSNFRFRPVVTTYSQTERAWILENLGDDGRPKQSQSQFVEDFNERFMGKVVAGELRGYRTCSSLTKELERFKPQYKAGVVPVPAARRAKK
ncbi:hypothetical protein K504DRAFT_338534, partial [Pleomassaria siparia CBS 279.74]